MDNSASQTPAASILEPNKHRQLPWLAVVLSLLVLSVIAALAFQNFTLRKQLSLITPPPIGGSPISPSPASGSAQEDWKTYSNKTYNFKLKYPSSWFSNNNTNDNGTLMLNPRFAPDPNDTEPYNPIHIYVTAGSNDKEKRIKEWESANFKATAQTTSTLQSNATAYSVEKIEAAPGPDKMFIILVPLKNGLLNIHVNEIQYTDTSYQILSTFQFLD